MHTLSDGATSAPVSPPGRRRTLHAFRSCCARTKSFIFLYRDSRFSPSDLCRRPAPLWACALAVPLPRASQQLSLPQKLFQMLFRVLPGLQRRPLLCTLRLRSLMHGVHAASATPAARREATRATGSWSHRNLNQRTPATGTSTQLRRSFATPLQRSLCRAVSIVGHFSATAAAGRPSKR